MSAEPQGSLRPSPGVAAAVAVAGERVDYRDPEIRGLVVANCVRYLVWKGQPMGLAEFDRVCDQVHAAIEEGLFWQTWHTTVLHLRADGVGQ